MVWFFGILVVIVMGVIAVVASGRGGSMAEVYDDRPDARVQAEGPLTAHDLRRVRFSTALRGYRMSEVDALLDRLAAEMEPGVEASAEHGAAPSVEQGAAPGRERSAAPPAEQGAAPPVEPRRRS